MWLLGWEPVGTPEFCAQEVQGQFCATGSLSASTT